jgi:hypothetical protein
VAGIGKRLHSAERRAGVISCHVLGLCSAKQACAAEGSIPTTRQHQSKLATSSDFRAIQATALRLSSSEAGVSPRQTFSASRRAAVQRRCSAVDRAIAEYSTRRNECLKGRQHHRGTHCVKLAKGGLPGSQRLKPCRFAIYEPCAGLEGIGLPPSLTLSQLRH